VKSVVEDLSFYGERWATIRHELNKQIVIGIELKKGKKTFLLGLTFEA
jgi:hypothetical protein